MSRNVNFVARSNRDDRHKLNYQLIEHTAVFHFTGFAEFSYRSHRTSSGPRALRSTEIRIMARHKYWVRSGPFIEKPSGRSIWLTQGGIKRRGGTLC